jgi:transcriptional regulator with XRE-family HTH domain
MAETRSPGDRIARLRETHRMTREALAERSGVPVELLASIEDSRYVPDLAPLVKIARALGVRLGTFMDDQENLGPAVTRKGEVLPSVRFAGANAGAATGATAAAGTIGAAGSLNFASLAAGKGGRHMEPFLIDIQASLSAGSAAASADSSHEGEEFIHVLSGAVVVSYGSERYELAEGDSIYYDSIVPHRVSAGGGKPARILAVVYAPL